MADSPADSPADLQLAVHHHGNVHTVSLPAAATIADLSAALDELLCIPPSHQKLMITPKPGLLKAPFKDPSLPVAPLASRRIVLLGSTYSEIDSLNAAKLSQRARARAPPPKASRHIDRQRAQDEATYTFTTLLPLPHLPNSQRSLDFLARLRADPGIKATMRTHKWTVPVLTEMDPAQHTTHESRTLGLNRNRGEVIELRLRTDAYDGYRDYRGVRNTLCHELAHNVFGDHDRNFWDLCKQIEREVAQGDWRSGGRALSDAEFYEPAGGDDGGEHVDGGAWTGGEFVLGAGSTTTTTTNPGGGTGGASGMSRREVLARAAEERLRRQREVRDEGEGSS
ncbi:MAG: hypothetical protein M1832_006053 [Thelocarpon impressellum]|nr:MAG: hypothetical protein M1832_006053 [Thelocarpon impressellum]